MSRRSGERGLVVMSRRSGERWWWGLMVNTRRDTAHKIKAGAQEGRVRLGCLAPAHAHASSPHRPGVATAAAAVACSRRVQPPRGYTRLLCTGGAAQCITYPNDQPTQPACSAGFCLPPARVSCTRVRNSQQPSRGRCVQPARAHTTPQCNHHPACLPQHACTTHSWNSHVRLAILRASGRWRGPERGDTVCACARPTARGTEKNTLLA
jgi:hypothetical protein